MSGNRTPSRQRVQTRGEEEWRGGTSPEGDREPEWSQENEVRTHIATTEEIQIVYRLSYMVIRLLSTICFFFTYHYNYDYDFNFA